jgi:hypothetical protein
VEIEEGAGTAERTVERGLIIHMYRKWHKRAAISYSSSVFINFKYCFRCKNKNLLAFIKVEAFNSYLNASCFSKNGSFK